MIALKHVLVATDFGATANVALTYGRELSRTFHATLHVVHVVDDLASRVIGYPELTPTLGRLQVETEADARSRLQGLLSEEDRRLLHANAIVLRSISPSQAILDYAREAYIDIIVLGTHGRGPLSHLFVGSVAERVLRSAACPVLIVKHPEREFVVPDALQVVARA